jgi:hypothetical protein
MPELGCSHGGGVGMSGMWRCLGKHRDTWDLASLSPVQVGLLPKCAGWIFSAWQKLDLEAGKSSQRRPRIWSWLRPPFDLADIPVRARGMRVLSVAGSNLLRSGYSLIVAHPFWRVSRALVLYAGV